MSRATATETAPEDLRTYLRDNQEALSLLDTIDWQRLGPSASNHHR